MLMNLLQKISKLPVGFGGAAISGEGGGYGFGDISENKALDLLQQAFDGGIKIFDTAPIYGFGLSEERIGKAFKKEREKVFIISKSGVTWHSNKRVDMSNTPEVTKKMLEQSLRSLDSDYIDLFMIHWPDLNVDIRKPLEVLAKAKMQGKIKHIGLCNTNLNDLEKAAQVEKIEVIQSELNVLNIKVVDEIFPYVSDNDISFMSWGTLDKGILTGQVSKKREQAKKYDDSDCRKNAPWWNHKEVIAKLDSVAPLWPFLKSRGHSGMEFAIAHNLKYPEVNSVLVGARNEQQLSGVFKALKNLPDQETLEEGISILKKIK